MKATKIGWGFGEMKGVGRRGMRAVCVGGDRDLLYTCRKMSIIVKVGRKKGRDREEEGGRHVKREGGGGEEK